MTAKRGITTLKTFDYGFKFATPSDQSRAIASFITPALIQGGVLGGRAPMHVIEADCSQSGKGYLNKLTAAIYNADVCTIIQSKVDGSIDELFDDSVFKGENFICLDNIRGKLDSTKLESFLTEDRYQATSLSGRSVEIDPSIFTIMMTSNKAEMTSDLADRSSIVRILKRDEGHEFKKYSEGDILAHIRANQPKYWGAILAIIKEWHRLGKPQTDERRMSPAFQKWASTLDWILQNILDQAPLLDNHKVDNKRSN